MRSLAFPDGSSFFALIDRASHAATGITLDHCSVQQKASCVVLAVVQVIRCGEWG